MQDQQVFDILSRHVKDSKALQKVSENPETNLFDVGLASMASFFMLDDFEQEGVHIEFTDFVAHPTLAFLREEALR